MTFPRIAAIVAVLLSCFAAVEAGTCTTRVKFPGVYGATIVLTDAANKVVGTWAGKNNFHTVSLDDTDSYTVDVTHGGVTVTTSDVTCTSGDVTDLTSSARLEFPGVYGVSVAFTANGVTQQYAGRNNKSKTNVLRGVYTATIIKADTTLTRELVCTGATCAANDLTCAMSVEFPGVHGVDVAISKAGASSNTANVRGMNNGVTESLLRDVYDVTLTHGGVAKTVSSIDCTGHKKVTLSSVSGPLSVEFSGESDVSVDVYATTPMSSANKVIAVKSNSHAFTAHVLCKPSAYYTLVASPTSSETRINTVHCSDTVVTAGPYESAGPWHESDNQDVAIDNQDTWGVEKIGTPHVWETAFHWSGHNNNHNYKQNRTQSHWDCSLEGTCDSFE
eukprot:GFYU01000393.1.p1 GENE.GFYU01000393.1~~GFYU01000393.1.p1  ORF type:complete len:390 (-),score=124.66 GFYU01000393.1:379-1548(-)